MGVDILNVFLVDDLPVEIFRVRLGLDGVFGFPRDELFGKAHWLVRVGLTDGVDETGEKDQGEDAEGGLIHLESWNRYLIN